MTTTLFFIYLIFAFITCFVFISCSWISTKLESYKIYKEKYNKLKDFSERNPQYYSSKTILKNQHIKEFRDPNFMDFYMQLDEYFVNTDLEIIKKHSQYYKVNRPKDVQLHFLMNKLIIMKEKEISFQLKIKETNKNLEDL